MKNGLAKVVLVSLVFAPVVASCQIPFLPKGREGSVFNLNGSDLVFNFKDKLATFSVASRKNGRFSLIEISGDLNDKGVSKFFGTSGVTAGASIRYSFGWDNQELGQDFESFLANPNKLNQLVLAEEKEAIQKAISTTGITSVKTQRVMALFDSFSSNTPLQVLQMVKSTLVITDAANLTSFENQANRTKTLCEEAETNEDLAQLLRGQSSFVIETLKVLEANVASQTDKAELRRRYQALEAWYDTGDKGAVAKFISRFNQIKERTQSGFTIGYSGQSFASFDSTRPTNKKFFDRSFQLPEIRYTYTKITPHGRFSLNVGYGEEVTNDAEEREFTTTSTITDPDSGATSTVTKKQKAWVGDISSAIVKPISLSYVTWLQEYKSRVGMSFTLASQLDNFSTINPNFTVFITEKGAPTKVLGGLSVTWRDKKPELALVTSIRF